MESTFEIYSRRGLLLDTVETQTRAEQLLGVWYSAAYVIEVKPNGDRKVVAEREELRP